MYMVTRTCKVIPKIIMKMRQVSLPLDFHDATSIWCRPTLDGSRRHLCTSQREYKQITCKNLARSKREQGWCYDPTIRYEALRQCAVPKMAYKDDSATDWTDSSDSEMEIETMTEEEAQSQKDKILDEAKEEQPFSYYPNINYEILKQFHYLDSPDSLTYSNLILNSDPKEELQPKLDKFYSETTQKQLYFIDSETDDIETETETESETEVATKVEIDTGTKTMAEKACKNKILAGTRDDQLFNYDPSINYEPLKRYTVPRFCFFDSSSTDWSDSLESSDSGFSDSESETETMAKKEAQSQEDTNFAGSKEKHFFRDDLVMSPARDLQYVAEDLAEVPSADLQSKPAVLNPSLLVNHGDKSPAELGDKVLKPAKEMDTYGG